VGKGNGKIIFAHKMGDAQKQVSNNSFAHFMGFFWSFKNIPFSHSLRCGLLLLCPDGQHCCDDVLQFPMQQALTNETKAP